MSCVFTKIFDNTPVSFVFADMELWVGAEETLKILRLPSQALNYIPISEKTSLKQLEQCGENNKLFITTLGVGYLVNLFEQVPERVLTFANLFLTDVVMEIKTDRLLCNIIQTENNVLNLLNTNTIEVV
uniref:Polyhedral envelope protein n=1 Tax=Adoxophyes orana granulovirus TaxID=170617 RepID=A0A0A0V9K5_GVAO|nr:polyhedral envelope protein [Adoxophyes orana granulovirus]AJA91658.1 polyhedral envelope protein 2 [Adoxophyes orana granulovirus]